MTVIAKKVKIAIVRRSGGMADAHGSGPCDSNIVRVQVPFPASLYEIQDMRKCWNWQTGKTKDLVSV